MLIQAATNHLARSPSADTTNAIASFRLQPGFRIEVVAAEPMVSSPVALAFDENNQLYAAENKSILGSSERRPVAGRIRVLSDLDEKGRFRTSTVFTEEVSWPSAVCCYSGGVFVASVKEVVYLKDTNGDGIADVRNVVLTGFGGTNAPDSQSLLSSFCWGLDNRIHAVAAGLGGAIAASDVPGEPVSLDGSDFSFDPRTLVVVPEAGGAGSGLCFDNFGRKYVSSTAHPLRVVMTEDRYRLRNPFYVRAFPLSDVISPATPVFHPVRWGDGKMDEGEEGKQTPTVAVAGLKSAQGLVIYRGALFPTNYAGNAFICDPEHHLVHRVTLQENGMEVVGTRAPNEQRTEFLFSSDPLFRPVQAVNGPDGALYVADARDGEQGRIYRVVPQNFVPGKPVKLGNATTRDLVSGLAHAGGWHRDTAARLLYEKRDIAALPLLSNMVSQSHMPLAKIHALHALAGSGMLREPHAIKALQDKDASVRFHALRAAESLFAGGGLTEAGWAQMQRLASDNSLRVRCQLALTVGAVARAEKVRVLAQVFLRDANNPWVQDAVMSSLGEGAGSLFVLLAADKRFRSDPVGLAFLRRLGAMIGVKGRLDEVNQVVEFLSHANLEPFQAFALVYAIGDGLHRTRSSLALVDTQGVLTPLYSTALLNAIEGTVGEMARVEAVRLVSVSPYTYSDTGDWLLLLANPHPLAGLRSAAVSTLTSYDDPRVLPALLERWQGFPVQLRRQAATGLLSRASRVSGVLSAMEQRAIPVGDLPSPTFNFLRTYPEPAISQRALAALGPVLFQRPAVVEPYKGALLMSGSVSRGREIFNTRCAGCHEMRKTANRFVGPDMAGVRGKGKEQILSDILQPSLRIEPDFRACVLETHAGEIAIGVKADPCPLTVTLLQPGGNAAVWPLLNIRSMRQEAWSLMPDGLEQGLRTQDMADLLECLVNPN